MEGLPCFGTYLFSRWEWGFWRGWLTCGHCFLLICHGSYMPSPPCNEHVNHARCQGSLRSKSHTVPVSCYSIKATYIAGSNVLCLSFGINFKFTGTKNTCVSFTQTPLLWASHPLWFVNCILSLCARTRIHTHTPSFSEPRNSKLHTPWIFNPKYFSVYS